ncbi:hypothetical protein BDZ89DRAFT_1146425 [Hymenopellis radicata]|nr:hypothetical protein BDZ89DRAFT_1146425 [Hymenopellis radicata]
MEPSHRERFSFSEDDVYIGNAQAKSVILGFIEQHREDFSPGKNEVAQDLFHTLIEWNGVCLGSSFVECGIRTMADLRRAAIGCTHAGFRKAFLMAFGMGPLDRNTASLGTLIRRVGCCDVKLQDPSLNGAHASLRMRHWNEVNEYLSNLTSQKNLEISQRDIVLAHAMEKLGIDDGPSFT